MSQPEAVVFTHDHELVEEFQRRVEAGASKKHLFVMARDRERAARVQRATDAAGTEQMSVGSSNFWAQKGDELLATLTEFGFTDQEAEQLADKLDAGLLLLLAR